MHRGYIFWNMQIWKYLYSPFYLIEIKRKMDSLIIISLLNFEKNLLTHVFKNFHVIPFLILYIKTVLFSLSGLSSNPLSLSETLWILMSLNLFCGGGFYFQWCSGPRVRRATNTTPSCAAGGHKMPKIKSGALPLRSYPTPWISLFSPFTLNLPRHFYFTYNTL